MRAIKCELFQSCAIKIGQVLNCSAFFVLRFVTDAVLALVVVFGTLSLVVADLFVLTCMVTGLEVGVSLN